MPLSPCRPFVPIGSKIGSFVLRILRSQVWQRTNAWTDGRTNEEHQNMSLSASLALWTHKNKEVTNLSWDFHWNYFA